MAKLRPLLLGSSLSAWSRHYLRAYLSVAPSRFHSWLFDRLDGLGGRRGAHENIVAPRAAAKSTISSMAYPIKAALEETEPYIIITSDTGQQAAKFLDGIRTELETNQRIKSDYPQAFGPGRVWRNDRIVLRNGVMIEALGTGTKLRGRRHRQHRPTLVIVDDPQNKEHILSPLQRERSWEWLVKDALNAGDPSTNYVVLGTALHRECIVCRLQRTPGWSSRVWRSIERWPERMDLWQEWEQMFVAEWAAIVERQAQGAEASYTDAPESRAFYEARRAEMDRGSVVLWPERESLYGLMALRATIGTSAFASEKQNDPVNPEACEWPPDYFGGPGFWFEKWPDDLLLQVLSLDPSKGAESRLGDYQAHVRVGRGKDGYLYVEADLRKQDIEAMVQTGCELCKAVRPDGFAIETNLFQSLLVKDYQRVGRKLGLESLPVYPMVNTLKKEVRIRRLTPYLSQRRFRFKRGSPGTALLVQQLQDWPVADHDDGPDALEMAVRLLGKLWGERRG